MKRLLLVSSLILTITFSLFSGDSARFVNLGFSGDGSHFMFAQYGYNGEKGIAYSDLYLVDVKTNRFVTGGVLHGEYSSPIEPGQSADGALYTLLEEAQKDRKRIGISYLEKGRPLYIRISDGENGADPDSLSFRDFETDITYSVDLKKNIEEKEGKSISSFSIDLKRERQDGVVKNYTVGHPDYKRKGIKDYQINRILLSPGEKNLVFILQKIDDDLNVRYMIETVIVK